MSSRKTANTPKPVRVAPMLTDPAMRNSKGPAEMLLSSEQGDESDDREVVFGGSAKTKEEQSASESTPSGETSTMLIIVFALVVIALVAIIVWMLVKQNNDSKDAEEMKRIITPQPHPRNGLPPNPVPQPHVTAEQQQQMDAINRQQIAMQQRMAKMRGEMEQHAENDGSGSGNTEDNSNSNPNPKPTAKSASTAVTSKSSSKSSSKPAAKPKPSGSKTFGEIMAEKNAAHTDLRDPLLPEEPMQKPKFSLKKPHPDIIRVNKPSTSDVDDILKQTESQLSASKSSSSDQMTDMDRAVLDKVTDPVESDDDDDDDSSDE